MKLGFSDFTMVLIFFFAIRSTMIINCQLDSLETTFSCDCTSGLFSIVEIMLMIADLMAGVDPIREVLNYVFIKILSICLIFILVCLTIL